MRRQKTLETRCCLIKINANICQKRWWEENRALLVANHRKEGAPLVLYLRILVMKSVLLREEEKRLSIILILKDPLTRQVF